VPLDQEVAAAVADQANEDAGLVTGGGAEGVCLQRLFDLVTVDRQPHPGE